MILVLAGTKESREIIKRLQEINQPLIASVVSDYGYQLLAESGIEVIQEKLTSEKMERLVKEKDITKIVDTTHPFAQEVSLTAIEVAQSLEIDYLRFEREGLEFADNESVIRVDSYEEAAKKAKNFNRILLTIGSRRLHYFVEELENWQERLVARVLPNWKFIKEANDLGFTPKNLIAMQGPFTKELNQRLLKDYQIDVLVTKASGKVGGLNTKLEAALELGVKVILIERPAIDYPKVVRDIESLIVETEG
ncbi:precorrin-6x reductase [Orenia metallireducens]|jgi:precorrin-6A/cobalt-precorrin-6A reductase|uniref:Precorrin-6x reductase n=1 Tax=Orenia metallireducens TaxID=1413210 RepID=A0A1C0A7E4_9FIRM|nr:cobalt-precorrin-6A reductase [Orenia metallireducens]OCL26134.1 precorrin-6x reductase [Orenia metallireducens]